ncbi:hypothetical protein QVD17_10577 [Tagetes erecta]|uniref:Uncharacterized protein n=1 Tax=Tagetes erecta TaxID=13708 RepID=A0AAD8L380_TARER|nr:hypothetical protein QVD17_10577 [Tagetes erecta]
MMPLMKQEPIEHAPEMKPPEIKSETVDSSPVKRLKTLTSDSPSKGKSKIEYEDDDSALLQQEVDTCGVCLLEEGMSLRGFIDSCDHYFCFVCIMEWAKVESRCPICKRRFSAIRRPNKDGVFLSERIVNVPVRDQIYSYNGNATIGPSDPYSQVKCSVCSGSSDENLLLLCDLCDSAAHSFCVGLGMTVPEGDWFCKDCSLSRDEHAKVETDTTSDYYNSYDTNALSSKTERFTEPEVSIRDIVSESSTREPDVSLNTTSVNQSGSIGEQSTVDRSNAPNARTLQRCLNVHSRIRVLRENWGGLRGGSLRFSSSIEEGVKTSQSQSSSLNHESSSQNHPYDIDKAWKMMGIAAKALGKKPGSKISVPKDSGFHKKKERLLNEASKVAPVRPNSNYLGVWKRNESELSSSKKIIASAQVKNDSYNCPNLLTISNVVGCSGQSSSIAADNRCAKKAIDAGLEKEKNIKKEAHFDDRIKEIGDAKSEIQSLVKLNLNLLNRDNCLNLSTASNAVGSSDQSSSIAADKRCAKKVIEGVEKEKNIKKDEHFDGSIREIEAAKSEIQSLVKLNLKLLSRDKKLEVDVFKEVARHATHSIMAACGIEPPKARFRSFERLKCDHSQTRKRPSSTLMPSCCRECFFIFVKDVVTAIAVDRTASCKA